MRKKIVGLIVLVVGALSVMYSMHLMQATHEAKQSLSLMSNPSVEDITLLKKASENDAKQAYMLIGGMIVLISGGGMMLLFRTRS